MATAHIEVPTIYTSMQGVMEGLKNVPRNGVMSFGQGARATSYNYLRADDVQEAINPLLSENKIVLSPKYSVTQGERSGRDYIYVHLSLEYISSIDGSKFPTVEAVGEAIAGDDKSINKALTQAIKNAHRATFQFASGEEDSDSAPAAPATKKPAQGKLEKAKSATRTPAKAAPKDEGMSDKEQIEAIKQKIRDELITPGKVTNKNVLETVSLIKKDRNLGDVPELYQAVYEHLKA